MIICAGTDHYNCKEILILQANLVTECFVAGFQPRRSIPHTSDFQYVRQADAYVLKSLRVPCDVMKSLRLHTSLFGLCSMVAAEQKFKRSTFPGSV